MNRGKILTSNDVKFMNEIGNYITKNSNGLDPKMILGVKSMVKIVDNAEEVIVAY